MKRKLLSLIPPESKEYKELMCVRKQMLKAIEMLEQTKKQASESDKSTSQEENPIIQKDK
jgi:hypothetical protein